VPLFAEFVRSVANSSTKYSEISAAQKDEYNPEVSNDITPKVFDVGNQTFIVYDYFPVTSPTNPNAESVYMIAAPKLSGKNNDDTIIEILKANKTLFSPGSTGITANMTGPQIASSIEKAVKDTLSQPQSLLMAADKVFTNLPAFIQPKFTKVLSGTKAAVTAVTSAKLAYDTAIKGINSTPGTVAGGGR
jgi:hypothetical protein